MFKSCPKCGKIHDYNFKCNTKRIYQDTEERELRNKYAWAKKSKEIRERANYLCEVCKDRGLYTYNNLEVHHITKLKENKKGLLDNYNLICLCVECHKKADNGEIDKEYLQNLAKVRERSEGM